MPKMTEEQVEALISFAIEISTECKNQKFTKRADLQERRDLQTLGLTPEQVSEVMNRIS